MISNIWKKVIKTPIEVTRADENIGLWNLIYQGNADWLNYGYMTVDGLYHKARRKTMNPAKIVCRELASLLWAETPDLTTTNFVNQVLEANNFNRNQPKYLEYMAALGAFAIKLYKKDEELKLDYITAESIIPLGWDNGGVTEASFLSSEVKDGKEYLRVETHKKNYPIEVEEDEVTGKAKIIQSTEQSGYKITFELFEVKDGDCVREDLNSVYPDLEPESYTSSNEPLFVYIKTPEANNMSAKSPIGISCFANARDTIEAIDTTFHALYSEILLGKKRIIVPTSALRTVIDIDTGTQKRYFDPSDEVYQAMPFEDEQSLKIHDNSVELRVTEIKEALQAQLDILSVQVGLSAGYLTFTQSGIKTATEVISNNSRTFKTRQSYQNQLTSGYTQLIKSIQAYGQSEGLTPIDNTEPIIQWDDSVIEDRNSKAVYWESLYMAKVIEHWEMIMHITGLKEKEAREKSAAILATQPDLNVFE